MTVTPDIVDPDMPEPMEIAIPKVMDVIASGVPVGTLEQTVEFDYTLQFNQNIELISTLEALRRYFRRAKNERLTKVYLNTRENNGPRNTLHIFTEKVVK